MTCRSLVGHWWRRPQRSRRGRHPQTARFGTAGRTFERDGRDKGVAVVGFSWHFVIFVSAAVDGNRRGLVDHWLHPIREVCRAHNAELAAITEERARLDRLCELNVIQQVKNVAADVFVLDAWARGQSLSIHGWVYSIANGLVTDLDVTVSRRERMEHA